MKWKGRTIFHHSPMTVRQGRPVWTLLPFAPDWRSLLDRADRPRYPAMRLFRQPRAMDWGAVSAEVREALRVKLKSGKPTG